MVGWYHDVLNLESQRVLRCLESLSPHCGYQSSVDFDTARWHCFFRVETLIPYCRPTDPVTTPVDALGVPTVFFVTGMAFFGEMPRKDDITMVVGRVF